MALILKESNTLHKEGKMVQWVEKEIQKRLLAGESAMVIAKALLKKKKTNESAKAFLAVCGFIYQSGLYNFLWQTAISRLKKKQTIPWPFVIEMLSHQKIKVLKEKTNYFLEGIKKQNQIESMLMSRALDKIGPELGQWKLKALEKINKEKNHKFVKLMADLEFVQAQGLLKKEEDILKELKKCDPENPAINDKYLQVREKWGRNLIQQKKSKWLKAQSFAPAPSEEEKNQAQEIAKSVQKALKKHREKSHDMALCFSFMGYPDLAIQILKNNIDSVSSKWLYLELLLQSKLYLNCLDFLDKMEAWEDKDPEAVFALAYARAKAYYGLGKKKQATDILSHLMKIRPNYRLTQYLLKQWEKGVN